MRNITYRRSTKIIAVVISTICFVLFAGMCWSLIYFDNFRVVPDTPLNYEEVVKHYQNKTLDEYTKKTGNLYTIEKDNNVLDSNYNGNNKQYKPHHSDYVYYNDDGVRIATYKISIYQYIGHPQRDSFFAFLDKHSYPLIVIAVFTLAIFIICILCLIHGAGHNKDSDIITLRRLDKIPFVRHTTYLFAFAFFQIILFIFLFNIISKLQYSYCLLNTILSTIGYLLVLNWFISLTILSRSEHLARRTFFLDNFKQISSSIFAGLKHFPLIRKTIIILIILNVCEFWIILSFSDSVTLLILFLLIKAITIPFVISIALIMQKFKEAGKNIANGDLDYRLYTSSMWGEFAEFGDTLNNISYGMNKALKDRMKTELKSEHFKTDLITNVSHDIKTPLTSIINYVDLIKKEELKNETVNQYISVLDRQSSRLKKLLEDLIEASKALTGNVKIDLVPCELNVLLAQISGEYEDLFAKKSLELVITPPEQVIIVMADSRHLWRIIDNLMTNIYKYSQENTRVYISLHSPTYDTNYAYLTFKNISKAQLNISTDELMERFTRGDSSRNTEGSGLGISIVKSLTELQGGVFSIKIDGDLFKAILRFDVIEPETEEDKYEQ